jgi:hypothetical protein
VPTKPIRQLVVRLRPGGYAVKWKHRWSLLAVVLLLLVIAANLSRTRATATPGRAGIMAHLGRSLTISAAPGRADAENTFILGGIQAPKVRILSQSLDMNMTIIQYAADPLGGGRWRIVNVEVPMVGHWGITVQTRCTGAWVTVGKVAYNVPFTGRMHLADRNQAPGY